MEEQGHCEHLWELSDENGFCFIVEYLNVKVIRNFRDADTSYLYGLYHIYSQLRSSLYAQRCIHKVQKVMFTISLLLHRCQKYISLSPLTYLTDHVTALHLPSQSCTIRVNWSSCKPQYIQLAVCVRSLGILDQRAHSSHCAKHLTWKY